MPDRSAWRGGWLVVAALLVIGAAIWALNRPSSSAPSSSQTQTQTPAPSHLSGPGSAGSARLDPECGAIPDCVVRDAVPPAVAPPARTYLPPGVRPHVPPVIAGNTFHR